MIRLSYAPEAEACYVYADVRPGEDARGVMDRTETVSEAPPVNLDYRADWTLYSIEILLLCSGREEG